MTVSAGLAILSSAGERRRLGVEGGSKTGASATSLRVEALCLAGSSDRRFEKLMALRMEICVMMVGSAVMVCEAILISWS